MRRSAVHGRREEILVRCRALHPGESRAFCPRDTARNPSLPLLPLGDATGNRLRMRLDGFSSRPLALRLRLHVPGTSAAPLSGLRLNTVRSTLPSVRGNDETPRGLMMNARLTDRDLRLLVKCAICRWLTTGQIQRLYFPKATLNAVQKRLRKLSDAGYLRSYREHPTAEAVHSLGPKGRPLVEEKGVEAIVSAEVPQQLEHLLGVNEIRIAVESSATQVAYFFSYWQLSDMGWSHTVIPDAVFAVSTPERHTFVIEYDRSTETLVKLLQKLRSYDRG